MIYDLGLSDADVLSVFNAYSELSSASGRRRQQSTDCHTFQASDVTVDAITAGSVVVDFTVKTLASNINTLEPAYTAIKAGGDSITAAGYSATTSSMFGYFVAQPDGTVVAREVAAASPSPERASSGLVATMLASLVTAAFIAHVAM